MNRRVSITNRLVLVFAVLLVTVFSVAYSALTASISVSGSTKYNVKKEIRITNVRLKSVTGGGVEYFNPSYTWNTITLGSSFSSSGTVVYEVEITNYSDYEYNILVDQAQLNVSSGQTSFPVTYTTNFTNPVGEGVYLITFTITGSSGTGQTNITIDFEDYISNRLYDVLKNAYRNTSYAQKYSGTHQDSIDSSLSTKNIYYWYASNSTNADTIQNMNNVMFANMCWKIVRTTDTGGVKLVYNGFPINSACLDSRASIQVGFNGTNRQSFSTLNNFYYGTSFTINGSKFLLGGNLFQGTTPLTGYYTCKSASSSSSCTTLYYILSFASGTGLNRTYNTMNLSLASHYSQFGKMPYNDSVSSIAYVGYKYNTAKGNAFINTSQNLFSSRSVSTTTQTVYYAEEVSYDSSTGNYSLVNPSKDFAKESLPGTYSFFSSSDSTTGSSVYYMVSVGTNLGYYVTLTGGQVPNDLNYTIAYSNSYTTNANNTYTLNSPTSFQLFDWSNNYTNANNKYICINPTGSTCSEIRFITKNSLSNYNYFSSNDKYKFSSSYTYDSTADNYTLGSDSVLLWDRNASSYVSTINSHHYTCLDSTDSCTSLKYFYYMTSDYSLHYLTLENGNSLEDHLSSMLSPLTITGNDSLAKKAVELWYKKYIYELEFDDYVEDVIYCNDRSIKEPNGLNPNGGNITNEVLFYNSSSANSLYCTNIRDRYAITSSSAKLAYKAGLLTYPEVNISGTNVYKTGYDFWLMSPKKFSTSPYVFGVSTSGSTNSDFSLSTSNGIRPVISLVPDIEYTGGDGSMSSPYIIATEIAPVSNNNIVFVPSDLSTLAIMGSTKRTCTTAELNISGAGYNCYDVTPGNSITLYNRATCYPTTSYYTSYIDSSGIWTSPAIRTGYTYTPIAEYNKVTSVSYASTGNPLC